MTTTTTKKRVTVSQLKQQLEWLEVMGHGGYILKYVDDNSMEYTIDIGIHIVDDDNKTIVLG